jgi:hypothetical protein
VEYPGTEYKREAARDFKFVLYLKIGRWVWGGEVRPATGEPLGRSDEKQAMTGEGSDGQANHAGLI